MIYIEPIIRGEPKLFAVTFLNADTKEPIDCTGWTLFVGLGRSRSTLGSVAEVSETVQSIDGQQGKAYVTFDESTTAEITQGMVMVDISVDTGTGNRMPLMLATAAVQSGDQYRQQYFQTHSGSNQLFKDVPTIVQAGASAPQNIILSFSTMLDPSFSLGVLVRFAELAPETKAYLDGLALDVTSKHADIMGAT